MLFISLKNGLSIPDFFIPYEACTGLKLSSKYFETVWGERPVSFEIADLHNPLHFKARTSFTILALFRTLFSCLVAADAENISILSASEAAISFL